MSDRAECCKHCLYWRVWTGDLRLGQCWNPESPENLEKQSVPTLSPAYGLCAEFQDRLLMRTIALAKIVNL